MTGCGEPSLVRLFLLRLFRFGFGAIFFTAAPGALFLVRTLEREAFKAAGIDFQ